MFQLLRYENFILCWYSTKRISFCFLNDKIFQTSYKYIKNNYSLKFILWTLYLPIFYRIESIDFSIGVSDQSMKLDKAHLSVTFRNKNHSPTIFTVSWNLVILWFGLIFRPLNKLKTRNECLKCMRFLNQTSSLSLTVKITFVPFGKAV